MKKVIIRILAAMLAGIMLFAPELSYEAKASVTEEQDTYEEAKESMQNIVLTKDIMALVYLVDKYPVRIEPSSNSAAVTTVASGQTVIVGGFEVDSLGNPWIKVIFCVNDVEYTGYIERKYIACSDELFLAWEQEFAQEKKVYSVSKAEEGIHADEIPADILAFPESYRASLLALKQKHPNWVFVKMDTGLNWNTVVAEEIYGGRSLVPTSMGGHLAEGKYSNGWSYPSKEALEYYLDPRNGLNENSIFQFELLSYNAQYHEGSEPALQNFLNNTFMKGNVPQWVGTYAYAFRIIGKEMNISPFHLASRVYQEQGKGTSPLISGTYPGYEGYYNYFNIGASGTNDKQVIESGLKYAKNANPPWDNPYYSLHFGAKILGSNYITKGQDTLYLQKFDVDASNNGMYWHQYMQNMCAPSSEAKTIYNLYNEVGAVDNMFIFKIPVYNNMPDSCPLPTESKRVVLNALTGYSDAQIYLDGVAYAAQKRNGYYIIEAADFNAKTATMYQYDEAGNPVGMSVWKLSSNGKSYTATEVKAFKDLLSYHGFSIRVAGSAGIRCKMGIAVETKEALTSTGLAGYKLKEYGTLIMANGYRDVYPLIKGGENVVASMSYGVDKDGNNIDLVFETVNGRHRFTALLEGLPAVRYKIDYAFRGYAVLQSGNDEIIIYGPIVHKSVYDLAELTLAMNLYKEGTDEYLFLKQLIANAVEPIGEQEKTLVEE